MQNNVICMKWGNKFSSEYVNRLYRMVQKNLSIKHRFICFTDNPAGIQTGVDIHPLPQTISLDENVPERGWRKLSVFAEKIDDLEGIGLFLDLDIVIRSNIDCFFSTNHNFQIIKDWDFPHDIIGNSSVFKFKIGQHPYVLNDFINNFNKITNKYRNEQAYLSYKMMEHGELRYWPNNWCISFKRNCLKKWPLCYFKMPDDPIEAKIIVFHGKPTPQQAYVGYVGKYGFRYIKPTKWLDKYWNV